MTSCLIPLTIDSAIVVGKELNMAGKKFLAIAGFALVGMVAFGLLIQLIPYGKGYTNPPVVAEPAWDSPETLALAQRACFDCHSNETVWPWYSRIAPVSWLVRRDVDEGRHHLNFSDWGAVHEDGEGHDHADKMLTVVEEGEMPPLTYLLMHPEAKLSDEEKRQLMDGLEKLK